MLKKQYFEDDTLSLEGLFSKKKSVQPSGDAKRHAHKKMDYRDVKLDRMDREVKRLKSDFEDVLTSQGIRIDVDDVIETLTSKFDNDMSTHIPSRSDQNLDFYIEASILLKPQSIGEETILSELLIVADVDTDKAPGDVLYSNSSFVLTYHDYGQTKVYKLLSTYEYTIKGDFGDPQPIIDEIDKQLKGNLKSDGDLYYVDTSSYNIHRSFNDSTLVDKIYSNLREFKLFHVGDIGDYTALFFIRGEWVKATFEYDGATWQFNV